MNLDLRTLYFLFSIMTLAMALTLLYKFYGNFKKGEGMLTAVLGINSQRVADGLHVQADLMPAPGSRAALDQRIIIEPLQYAILGQ